MGKDAVAADRHHGILSGKTGEDPRTETFNKTSHGVLSSMRCSVDSDMGNDPPLIVIPKGISMPASFASSSSRSSPRSA
jgi:hypothetical protein